MRTVKSIKESIKLIQKALVEVSKENDTSRITGLLIALNADKQALVDAIANESRFYLLFSDECPHGAIVTGETYALLVSRMTREDKATHQLTEIDNDALSLFERFTA